MASTVSEPPKKLFRSYRNLRQDTKIQSSPVKLRNRHNFFLRLPEEDRIRAQEIVLDQSGIYGTTNKDKVDFICAALKFQYKICNAHGNYKMFVLNNDCDCVLMGKDPDLYVRIIDYFKTMLNI